MLMSGTALLVQKLLLQLLSRVTPPERRVHTTLCTSPSNLQLIPSAAFVAVTSVIPTNSSVAFTDYHAVDDRGRPILGKLQSQLLASSQATGSLKR